LLDWRHTLEFVLGPYLCGAELSEVSAADFAKSAERDTHAFCRQGLGALILRLAQGLPVELSSPVSRIEAGRRGRVQVSTAKGQISARAAIVTVSTGVLARDKIKFEPALPKRYVEAIGKLKLGSYDHIALELPGNPLGLQRDDLVFEKANGARTAALLANVSGAPLCVVGVGGKFGRELSAQGEAAMTAFAADWLGGLYGAAAKRAVRRKEATRWNEQPWILGASSVAAPGGQWARAALMEPVRDAIWFAGEAVHETLWGTLGGAWQSGERAAEAAMRRLGHVAEPRPTRESPQRRAPARARRTR
jgi:monoamine oxidase